MFSFQTSIFNDFDMWSIVKWLYVAGYGVYLLFSLIVWRQIQLMGKTLNGSMYLPMRLMGVALVVMAAVAMLLALVIL